MNASAHQNPTFAAPLESAGNEPGNMLFTAYHQFLDYGFRDQLTSQAAPDGELA